jgi:hypothetical protein
VSTFKWWGHRGLTQPDRVGRVAQARLTVGAVRRDQRAQPQPGGSASALSTTASRSAAATSMTTQVVRLQHAARSVSGRLGRVAVVTRAMPTGFIDRCRCRHHHPADGACRRATQPGAGATRRAGHPPAGTARGVLLHRSQGPEIVPADAGTCSSPRRARFRRSTSSRMRPGVQVLPGRVGDRPVLVAFAGEDRAGVAAAHRDDHVGGADGLVGPRFGELAADVDGRSVIAATSAGFAAIPGSEPPDQATAASPANCSKIPNAICERRASCERAELWVHTNTTAAPEHHRRVRADPPPECLRPARTNTQHPPTRSR